MRQDVSGPCEKAPARPEPFNTQLTFNETRFQLAPYLIGAIHAHTHQSRSASGQPTDCGNADSRSVAVQDDCPLTHVEENCSAHTVAPRFAAAIASRAFVYR